MALAHWLCELFQCHFHRCLQQYRKQVIANTICFYELSDVNVWFQMKTAVLDRSMPIVPPQHQHLLSHCPPTTITYLHFSVVSFWHLLHFFHTYAHILYLHAHFILACSFCTYACIEHWHAVCMNECTLHENVLMHVWSFCKHSIYHCWYRMFMVMRYMCMFF